MLIKSCGITSENEEIYCLKKQVPNARQLLRKIRLSDETNNLANIFDKVDIYKDDNNSCLTY